MSLSKRVRSLDVFKKVPIDLSEATNIGGAISLIALALILYFTWHECWAYFNPDYSAIINFDRPITRDEMTINVDIEFPRYPCEIISLDLDDVMASHHPNLGSVQKWRLDKEGNYIDSKAFELMRQSSAHKQLQTVREALKEGRGCRLIGSFTVKEVPGNFHISCHGYLNHYMQMTAQGLTSSLDMGHIIHSLYFGKQHHLKTLQRQHPQARLHLLQGKKVQAGKGQSVHYHIDVVPTHYHQSAISHYRTYQYTYTENLFAVEGMPGVVHFNYHIGGMQINIMPTSQHLPAFLVHLCAIIGGLYALAHALHNLASNFTQKYQYQLIS